MYIAGLLISAHLSGIHWPTVADSYLLIFLLEVLAKPFGSTGRYHLEWLTAKRGLF